MGVFRRNKRAVGYHLVIGFLFCMLVCSGCTRKEEVKGGNEQKQEKAEAAWQPSYELTEATLLSWDFVQEVETDSYVLDLSFFRPEFSLKEGAETLCGENKK